MKKYITIACISCFAITSCIFQDELGEKCRIYHHHDGPIEPVQAAPDDN